MHTVELTPDTVRFLDLRLATPPPEAHWPPV